MAMSMWSDVKAKTNPTLHAEAGTRWSLIPEHQDLPTALLQKNLWIRGNLPPEPGLCSSWQASSVRHVRSLEVRVQRRSLIGGEAGERLERELPVLSRWPILRGRERTDIWWLGIRSFRRDQTAKTGKKAARQDRIMHFPLSAALSDTLVCRAEPKGNIWGKQFTMSIGKHGPKHMHVHSCSGPPAALRVPWFISAERQLEKCRTPVPAPPAVRQASSFLVMMSRSINRQTVHSLGLLSWYLSARITASLRGCHRPAEVKITWPSLGMRMW